MRKKILLITAIVAASLVCIFVLGFGFFYLSGGRMFYVPTGAMMNTILPGDRLLGRQFAGELKRGQVVVVQYPGDSTYRLGRVIGLPKETIEIRDRFVHVNGQPLDEERVIVEAEGLDWNELKEISTEGKGPYRVYYIAGEEGTRPLTDYSGPLQLPPNAFYVMGDNRDNSEDSRYLGPVPRELIWGEVFMIYFSSTIDGDELRWNRTFKRVR